MNAVHPIFDQFCRVVSGDAARAAMRPFRVLITGPDKSVWHDFDAVGYSSCEVQMDWMHLAEGGKMVVKPMEGKQ